MFYRCECSLVIYVFRPRQKSCVTEILPFFLTFIHESTYNIADYYREGRFLDCYILSKNRASRIMHFHCIPVLYEPLYIFLMVYIWRYSLKTYYLTLKFFVNLIGLPPCIFRVDKKIRMNFVYAVQKVLRNHATHAFHFMHLCMIILSLTKMNKQFFQVVRDTKHYIETIIRMIRTF